MQQVEFLYVEVEAVLYSFNTTMPYHRVFAFRKLQIIICSLCKQRLTYVLDLAGGYPY